jgi:hypothetical protein
MSLRVWESGTHFKHEEPLATEERRARKVSRKQRLADAYEAVDKRDVGVCWVTGRYTSGPALETRRDHHHLGGRNAYPEWKYDPDRIITVCGEAHSLITTGKLLVEGDDATKAIFFHWNTPAKYRPFEILPVRLRKVRRAEVQEAD